MSPETWNIFLLNKTFLEQLDAIAYMTGYIYAVLSIPARITEKKATQARKNYFGLLIVCTHCHDVTVINSLWHCIVASLGRARTGGTPAVFFGDSWSRCSNAKRKSIDARRLPAGLKLDPECRFPLCRRISIVLKAKGLETHRKFQGRTQNAPGLVGVLGAWEFVALCAA